MKIRLYTICTAKKNVGSSIVLAAKDYRGNVEGWKEAIYSQDGIPASNLYQWPNAEAFNGLYDTLSSTYGDVEHYIISAGAGIVERSTKLQPYNCSFAIESGENQVDAEWFETVNNHDFSNDCINLIIVSKPYFEVLKHIPSFDTIKDNSIIFSSSTLIAEDYKTISYDKRARAYVKGSDSTIISKYTKAIITKDLLPLDIECMFNQLSKTNADILNNQPIPTKIERESIDNQELTGVVGKKKAEGFSFSAVMVHIRDELLKKASNNRVRKIYEELV